MRDPTFSAQVIVGGSEIKRDALAGPLAGRVQLRCLQSNGIQMRAIRKPSQKSPLSLDHLNPIS